MCGIAGYFGTRPPEDERLDRALAAMRHRGPDHAARRTFHRPSGRVLHLLHTRLSIIDLDPRAHQPMAADGRHFAVNGELYNYLELRSRLETDNEAFRTSSDTEVFLRHLILHGLEGLSDCEGMWAFALYDEAEGILTLCRDRFGEKPLYLLRADHGIFFASEVKLLATLAGPLRPNLRQVKRHLVNGYKSLYKSGETFFEGVTECPPGSWIRIDPDGREEIHEYWRPRFAPEEAMSYDEAVAGARARLLRSVELRLRADVPLAFCLSGGVDSNALVAIARRIHGHDVHGFTITSGDPRYCEGTIAAAVAGELGIRHTLIPAETTDFLPRLRDLVRHHGAPVATITYYAHWMIERSIAEHGYRVSLSGTAADELFSGYYDHHLAYLAVLHGAPEHTAARVAWERTVKPNVRNPHLGDPDLFVRDSGFRDHIFLHADRFSSWLVEPWNEPFAETHYAEDLLRNRMLNELRHESVPVILHEDDLNAMAFSIENRSPYLDAALCDFCFSIPSRHLVRNGVAKAILRDAVRGIVPDLVLDNPRKVGFNLSILSCLDGRDPAVRAELLGDSPILDVVRRERIADLLDRDELPNSESKFLFNVINAKFFLEEFGR